MATVSICIVGGKLQGVEACYLAQKAGWHITLVDKNPNCTAKKLAHEFICLDVFDPEMETVLVGCDLLLPAIEEDDVLQRLAELSQVTKVPLAHDPKSYDISASKLKSDQFFRKHKIPAPAYYPDGKFPMIAKPSGESGSRGVVRLDSQAEVDSFLELRWNEDLVLQEYLEGRSYSIEVVGNGETYLPLQVTEIKIDEQYDCNRVEAGVDLTRAEKMQMHQIGKKLGKALGICGIFDVETILCDGQMYVLEIDARLPSQTPTAVYLSTGINILEVLHRGICHKSLDCFQLVEEKFVIYEHIFVDGNQISFPGEHMMSQWGSLQLVPGFYGAKEALTSRKNGDKQWVATLMFVSDHSLWDADQQRNRTIAQIQQSI